MKKIIDVNTFKSGTNSPVHKGGRSDKYLSQMHNRIHGKYVENSPYSEQVDVYKLINKYKFKGFEFGNWVTQTERNNYVETCVPTFQELASIMGSDNLGFDYHIGIAFGARGRKGAAAHYESLYNMINITREKGAGSLAHEYGHALDSNFGAFVDQNKLYTFLSGGRSLSATLPDNVGGQLRAMVNQICDSYRNSDRYIAMKSDPTYINMVDYYYRRTEIFARFFEQFVAYKLKQKGIYNALLTKRYETYIFARNLQYMSDENFKKLVPIGDKLVKLMGELLNGKNVLKATAYPSSPIIKRQKAITKTKKITDAPNKVAANKKHK